MISTKVATFGTGEDSRKFRKRGLKLPRRSSHHIFTDIEAEVRLLPLRHPYGVVESGGQMDSARHDVAQVLCCFRLLRKACRGHDGRLPRTRQRNANPPKQASAKARTLAADAEDCG